MATRPNHTRRYALAAALPILIALVLVLRPSPVSRVANLGSQGSAIIAFGDSLTAGYGAGPGEDYPSGVSRRLSIAVMNAGVSGDTTEGALARLDDDVLSRDPRIVLVGLGGNDFLQSVPIAATEANLRTIVRRIRAAGAMVVLLGFRFPSLNADYDAMYKRIAADEKALLVPRLLKGILDDPSLKSDAIHPNARGYALMAERVADPLAELIAKADSKRR